MSDLHQVRGFEDDWRAKVGPGRSGATPARRLQASLGLSRDRLSRLVGGAREVMVTVTGAVHSRPQLVRHLDYISRNGTLALEDQDGFRLSGRDTLKEMAADWHSLTEADSLKRPDSPIGRTLVFSMPPKTDPAAFDAAVRDCAIRLWRERFEFAWVRHTDTAHPHAHLVIRAMGVGGQRFTPDRADLRTMREGFAEELRARGVAAEATPRHLRGVTRKAESLVVRKMREQYERGEGPPPRTLQAAYIEASDAAFNPSEPLRPWEVQIVRTQSHVRGLYLEEAERLAQSPDEKDQQLAKGVESFVAQMPPADTQRLEIARQLRELADVLKERAEQHRARIR